MFTRNYWLYQAANFVGKTEELSNNSATVKPPYITANGEKVADTYGSTHYYYMSRDPGYWRSAQPLFQDVGDVVEIATSSSSSKPSEYSRFGCAILFGSGNTPPTIDDYKLEGTVATNCTYSVVTNKSYESDGSQGVHSRTYTITNNNDTEITIGEIGFFIEETHMTAYKTMTSYPILCERTALESPITIPAGGVGQVEYTIRMNYPVSVTTE